jgi:hypothetical protein
LWVRAVVAAATVKVVLPVDMLKDIWMLLEFHL